MEAELIESSLQDCYFPLPDQIHGFMNQSNWQATREPFFLQPALLNIFGNWIA
jgi:hypothetical protein